MRSFPDYKEITFNWLNKSRAIAITDICKSYGKGITVKRLAQERGALGQIKIIVRCDSHSWATAIQLAANVRQAVIDAGFTNSLTF